MIKVYTPFSYSFGNVGTVSNFWTPHEEILRGSFELALSSKTKSRGQVSRAHADEPTRQDVIWIEQRLPLNGHELRAESAMCE